MNRVIKLCERYYGSYRCITADNFFSSIFLAQNLFKQKLEFSGTLNKNKLEIPIEFKAFKSRKIDTSILGFNNSLTLVSFVPKENKAVLLVSTSNHAPEINSTTNKPEIILDYNKDKGICI
jgi:hypothetical protein